MNKAGRGASIVAVLVGLLFAPTPLEARTGFFRFTVCNRSASDADVAVHGNTGIGWEVSGWYRVRRFTCRQLGIFRVGMIDTYARATDGRGVWDGYNHPSPLEVRLCLQYPGPFKRATAMVSDLSCLGNERLEFMRTHIVTGTNYTWSLLGPGY